MRASASSTASLASTNLHAATADDAVRTINVDPAIRCHGASTRLKLLRQRLENGRNVSLVALGGSSTAGHMLARDSPILYHQQLAHWLDSVFPAGWHQAVNSGTPATGPMYMEKCLSVQMPHEPPPGLVLVEYGQNMRSREDALALERLLRRLLQLPSRPAVILLSLPIWEQLAQPFSTSFHEQQTIVPLAEHYGIPRVSLLQLLLAGSRHGSMSSSLQRTTASGEPLWLNLTSGWFQCGGTSAQLGKDPEARRGCAWVPGPKHPPSSPHPNRIGHSLVARSIAHLLQLVWSNVSFGDLTGSGCEYHVGSDRRSSTVSSADLAPLLVEPSPQPLWYRTDRQSTEKVPNVELPLDMCIGPEEVRRHVRLASGWDYVVEGSRLHAKPGLRSTRRNATLELCYPVVAPARAQHGSPPTKLASRTESIAIGFLRSYDASMGNAAYSCHGGCTCNADILKGHHTKPISILWIEHITVRVSSAPRTGGDQCPCTLRVTSIARGFQHRNATRLGSKFKVSMMMVGHEGDTKSWINPFRTSWMAVGDRMETSRGGGGGVSLGRKFFSGAFADR